MPGVLEADLQNYDDPYAGYGGTGTGRASTGAKINNPFGSTMSMPLSKIELSISCRNLKNMDFFSKSDPMVVVYQKQKGSDKWIELGRTETIRDNLNPDFVTKFVVDLRFEEVQPMGFAVFDIDVDKRNLKDQDFIGEIEVTLAEIAQGTIKRELFDPESEGKINPKSHGQIIINSEEIFDGDNDKFFTIQAKAYDVKRLRTFLKTSPPNVFMQISKVSTTSNHTTVVYRTKVQKATTQPNYQSFELGSRELCNGDLHRGLIIEMVHEALNGDLKTLHKFQTTPYEMEENPYLSLHDGKTSLKLSIKVLTKPTFVSYLNSGLELNFHVAVDYTGSNGDPRSPSSLHYISNTKKNPYEFTIGCVGTVLQQYDTDRLFPCYGFGAKLPPAGQVSHDFCLSFIPDKPEVEGLEGIINAYKRSLASVRLYGPTNFSPIIRRVTEQVIKIEESNEKIYTILLILTDGMITDINSTIDAIVDASEHAMSIVIIGIGDQDFKQMEILDGDEDKLKSPTTGKMVKRDIVQFVNLSDYYSVKSFDATVGMNQDFNKAVLLEVPGQVVDYFMSKGIVP